MSALEHRDDRTPEQILFDGIRSEQFQQQLELALPDNVTPRRFVRIAMTALQKTPEIATLERGSVIRSLLEAAAMGLMPDGNEAALVPFKGNAQLIPMIGGYRKIAAKYGWQITAAVVYEHDAEFEYTLGLNPTVVHRPGPLGVERGRMIAVYAYGTHRDGRKSEPVVMTAEDVAKRRAVSKQPNGEMWSKWPERAWEKTAGRALFKRLPLGDDERVVRVMAADLPPQQAEEALYGAPARRSAVGAPEAAVRALNEGTPAVGADADPAGAPPAPAAGDQQAGEESGVAADASPAPEPEDAPEPAAEGDELSAAEEALDAVFPSGEHKGKSLRTMLVDEPTPGTLSSIRWALLRYQTDPFRSAVWVAARVYAPELAAAVEKTQAGEG